MDVVHGDALEPHRADVLTGMALLEPRTRQWLIEQTGHEPDDEQVWRRALTHGSAQAGYSYERLEFLGDSVLNFVIAESLYKAKPDAPEGILTRFRASLVNDETLATLAREHRVSLISIGNGTASRETDKLAGELIQRHPELKLQKIMVSEAGASVYSASELAARGEPTLLDLGVAG